ncbi:MAG: capsular biosynthesis protein [Rikenellaceae bacterium]|nr:capsular biosynthesis protein [Rikenellaceae bacterium]
MFDFFTKRYSLAESGILSGSVDAHSHILFGVDDGAAHREDALAMLEFEESLGVREVWCTPHIMEDVPNTTEQLKERFELLQSLYKGPIKLHLAAEYMIDTLFLQRLKNRDLLLHRDGLLLIETSANNPPLNLFSSLALVRMKGITPILAHPERYRYLKNEDYSSLVADGVKLQLNLSSLTGYYGRTAMEKAKWLLENDMYSTFGSDCHRVKGFMEQYNRKAVSKHILEKLYDLARCQ